MICVCHKNNTIDKARFLDERNKLYAFYDGPKLPILKDIFENNKAQQSDIRAILDTFCKIYI